MIPLKDFYEIEFINETSEGKRPIKLFMKPKKSEGSINSLNMQADAQARKIIKQAVKRVLTK